MLSMGKAFLGKFALGSTIYLQYYSIHCHRLLTGHPDGFDTLLVKSGSCILCLGAETFSHLFASLPLASLELSQISSHVSPSKRGFDMGFNYTALQANIHAHRTWAKMCYVESILSEFTLIFCWKATGSTAQHVWDKGVFSLKKSFHLPFTWSCMPNRHWAGSSQPSAGEVKNSPRVLEG